MQLENANASCGSESAGHWVKLSTRHTAHDMKQVHGVGGGGLRGRSQKANARCELRTVARML